MRIIQFLFIVAAMALPSLAVCQTQEDVSKWIPEFRKKTDDLDRIEENLRNMSASPGIRRDEYQELNLAENYVRYFSAIASGLLQISYVYSAMRDPRDVVYVKNHLVLSCGNLRGQGKNATLSLNQILPMSTNSAIRTEITNARDVVSSITSTLLCS